MATSTPNDIELAGRLAAGDRAAFEELYRRHNRAMVRLATAIVRSRDTAEDVAQDTWVAVLRNIGGFQGRSSLAAWIFTILSNAARSRAARDGRMVSFDSGGDDADDGLASAFDGRGRWRDLPALWDEVTPERVVAGRSLLDHVNRAIESLPPSQQAVLLLRGQKDLEPADVCATLGISDGAMRVLLHRARLAVRRKLDAVLAECRL